MHLHYLGRSAIVLQGAATGREYGFSPGRPVQPVDIRDAIALLASGLFRRARAAV
jgi:hypothetical protein